MNYSEGTVSRRGFLKVLTMAGAAAALPVFAGDRPAQAQSGYVTIGKLAKFKSGDYTGLALPDGVRVFVAIDPKDPGKVIVLSASCTHKGCDVQWYLSDKQFLCPCHRGKYDANGVNISGPPPRPLPTIPSRVVNGDVQVNA